MTEEPAPIGRPSDYTPELAAKICAELAAGVSLRTVCLADEMPCTATVFVWFRKHPEFLEQYERAKAECADALVEEMLDIADDGTNDWMEKHSKEGENIGWQVNGEHVQRSRLRVDTRKWAASKLKPKKYGDRLDLNPDPALPANIKTNDAADKLVELLIAKGASEQEIKNVLLNE